MRKPKVQQRTERRISAALRLVMVAVLLLAQMVGVEPTRQSPVLKHFESISLRPLRYVCLFSFYRTAPHSVWKNARFRCKITMKGWVRDTR